MSNGMQAFFDYSMKRHQCYVMKHHDPAWRTNDKILQEFSFTNVFRELDKTTVWFRENVRDPMSKARDTNILLATVVFRMLNRIEVGEAMFRDDDLLGGHSAFDEFKRSGKVKHLKDAIVRRLGKKGPYATGAYIISSVPGMKKLDGILEVLRRFDGAQRELVVDKQGTTKNVGWHEGSGYMAKGRFPLEKAHDWLSQFEYLGNFHAYEIVTDLRWTYLLGAAPDRNSWCNPGPGCKRGLNRVFGRDKDTKWEGGREEILEKMMVILEESESYWPDFAHRMRDLAPKIKTPMEWEMRDVEHTLCEFDKYERTRLGEGRPRGKYKGRGRK